MRHAPPDTPSPANSTAGDPARPWAEPIARVLETYRSDPVSGLRSDDATVRLERDGRNEIAPTPPAPLWSRFARQFVDPLVVLLLAAIAISLLAWWIDGGSGAPVEALVIAAIVLLNAGIGTWQESRAMDAVAALRQLAALHSTVVRDGRSREIPTADLVCGDILLLAQGDAVGADCRLIEAASLTVAEAPLTGESTTVEKLTAPVAAENALADRNNMVFQGTAVTLGRGVGVVTATGMSTEIGRVARLLDEADAEPTPLQRQIDWLGRVLGWLVVVLATVVVIAITIVSDVDGFGGLVDAALVGVSLAVAAVPEGLPAILTIVLAIGVQRMAADRAIVKQLSSVETLGSASVICTDKTGTLTRNEMSVVAAVVPSARVDITGVGYRPVGDVFVDGDRLDDVGARRELEALLIAASVANDAVLEHVPPDDWDASGDPTELALLVAAHKVGVAERGSARWRRIGEIPFDSERKLMSVVAQPIGDDAAAPGTPARPTTMFTKGAPDVLVDRCDLEVVDGVTRPLTAARRTWWSDRVDALAGEALRPLAVASRPVATGEPSPPTEDQLALHGVVGLIDPPRAEVKRAIGEAQRGRIRVVMITGDHPRTATQIARDLDLDGAGPAITGRELADLDDDALGEIATTTSVYARVDPEQKLRLVRALQHQGFVTAMTGDGVNDGPALKQADIGVAMGRHGTDVAKDAADVVLADDNFATILRAVREGREIYADIRKFIRYLLASNTGEVLVVLLGVLLAGLLGLDAGTGELAVPLLATQILWINLVTDGLLALALGVDPSVEDVMDRPPRPLDERIVDRPMLRTIAAVGLVTALVSLVALDLELAGGMLGGTGSLETARTMAFSTLVLAQVCNALSARSDVVSAFERPFDNHLFWVAAGVTVAAQVSVVHVPGLRHAFDAVPLSLEQWATCAGLAAVVLVAAETVKLIVRAGARNSKSRQSALVDRSSDEHDDVRTTKGIKS